MKKELGLGALALVSTLALGSDKSAQSAKPVMEKAKCEKYIMKANNPMGSEYTGLAIPLCNPD